MNYAISNDVVSIVVSSRGAELRSISSSAGTRYLWDGDETYWPDCSPILFPFVGRLTKGQYRFRGTQYPMDIHGFARQMEFEEGERTRYSLELILRDTQETFKGYPFHFILKIKYTLIGETIQIRYHVENKSEETMYFGIGSHPGFRVPLEQGLEFSDYYLEFSEKHTPARVGHTEQCFLNGTDTVFELEGGDKLPLSHSLFDEDAIVLKHVAGSVVLKSDKGERSVTVTFPDLPYLGLWHAPRTEAPYLCIEAWSSLPSRQDIIEDFQCKSDLIRLHAHDCYETQWEITIR